jgi:hypothetical protein
MQCMKWKKHFDQQSAYLNSLKLPADVILYLLVSFITAAQRAKHYLELLVNERRLKM